MSDKFKSSLSLSIGAVALLLTGCSSVLYSNNTAPVYDRTGMKKASQQPAQKSVEWKQTGQPTVKSIEPPQVVSSTTNTVYQTPAVIEQSTSPAINNNTGYIENQTVGSTSASEFGITQNPFENSAKVESVDPRIKSASEMNSNVSDTAQQPSAVIRPQTPMQSSETYGSKNTATDVMPQTSVDNPVETKPGAKSVSQALRPTQQITETNAKPLEVEPNQVASKTSAKKPVGTGSAVKDLIRSANKSVLAGDYEKAASELERAHRIKPGDAKILFDIAQVRFAQGKYSQAESFASRAASVATTSRMKKKIWTLLSKARKALGNNSGAATALKKANSF